MHARMVIVQLTPGRADQAITLFKGSVLPAAQAQRGFKGAFLLTDRRTGKFVSLSLWETEADLNASEESGYYQEQIAKFAGVGVFAGAPVRETYEVSVQS